jgi:hypothetical protein
MKDNEKKQKWQRITSGLAQWRHYPADNFVGNGTLLPRGKFSGSRHCAKPPGRYRQFADSAQKTGNYKLTKN